MKEQIMIQMYKYQKKIIELENLIRDLKKKIENVELLKHKLKEQQKGLDDTYIFQKAKLDRLIAEFPDSLIATRYYDGMCEMIKGKEYTMAHQSVEDSMVQIQKKGYEFLSEIEQAKIDITYYENEIRKLRQELKQLSAAEEA